MFGIPLRYLPKHPVVALVDNVRFELDRAWTALRPNGALIIDDVDASWGFRSLAQTFPGHPSLICETLHPD